MEKILNELNKINNLIVRQNVPLKKYTTFKVGGPALFFLIPETKKSLLQLIKTIKNIKLPHFVLGKGSNVIVSDKGFKGIIIYTGHLDKITVQSDNIIAQSGATLKNVAETAQQNSLTGIEFASGIPGSLGGAIFMNAGAYGGEMSDIIKEVSAFKKNGHKIILKKEDLNFSYRNSIFQSKEYIITTATLGLKKGNKDKIKEKMQKLNQKRKNKQPIEYPSAGSSFKRPKGYYTGPLIEKANLKGHQIGGAQVSEKHAGFIVNKGNATAKDIVNLIRKIQKEVYKTSGVKLKPEPKFLGKF